MRAAVTKRLMVFLFLLCALPAGLGMAVLTPAGQVPDEQAHMARALGLLRGAVLAERRPDTDPFTHQPVTRTGLKVDLGLFNAAAAPVTMVDGSPIVTAQNYQAAAGTLPNPARAFVDLPNTAGYFPLPYLPAALAVAIGLAFKATPYACFLMARVFMLCTYLLLGGLALWVAAFGEAALLTILLLPMALYLAGAVSQDGVVLALSCLACAALSRGGRRSWLAGLAAFVVVLLSNAAYAPLLAVFLLPYTPAGVWARLRGVALACVPVLLWAGLVVVFVAVPYPVPLYHPGPLFPGDAGVTLDHAMPEVNLHILLAQPARLWTIPWATLQIWTPPLAREMTGVLGLLRIGFPMVYYQLWAVCGAAALAGLLLCPRPARATPGAALAGVFITAFAVAATAWLIMIVFYIEFTNAGWTTVTGLQGRYLLPALPFLIFLLPGLRLPLRLSLLVPAIPALLLGLFDAGFLPLMILHNYYLH